MTLAALALLSCGVKAPPRPPLPAKPTAAAPSAAQPAPAPAAPSQDCPGCPPPDDHQPSPEAKP